jgi:hypothetical protein
MNTPQTTEETGKWFEWFGLVANPHVFAKLRNVPPLDVRGYR